MCDQCDEERERLVQIILRHPQPCIVCHDPAIVGAGSWIPDESRRIAAGGPQDVDRIFAFCLCAAHAEPSPENEKAIIQAILRQVREGKGFQIGGR